MSRVIRHTVTVTGDTTDEDAVGVWTAEAYANGYRPHSGDVELLDIWTFGGRERSSVVVVGTVLADDAATT